MTGAEELRAAVRMLNGCSESFLDRHTLAELVTICRAWRAAEHDYPPDTWTTRQVAAAIRGIVPRWNDKGEPSDPPAHRRVGACVEVSA